MRRDGAARAPILAAVLWLAVTATDDAVGGIETGSTEALDIVASAPWPGSLRRGWQPVFVEVGNHSDRTQRVRVRLTGTIYREREFAVTDAFDVDPGATASREIPIPVCWDDQVFISVSDERNGWVRSLDAGKGSDDRTLACVVFEAGSGHWITSLMPPSGSSTVEIEIARMPRKLASYTGLDVVYVDLSGEPPSAAALDAVLGWTRLGGRLVLVGEQPDVLAHWTPALAVALDDSQRIDRSSDYATFRCGLGRLVTVGRLPLPSAESREAVRLALATGAYLNDGVPHDGATAGLERPAVRHFHSERSTTTEQEVEIPAWAHFVPRFTPQATPEAPLLGGPDVPRGVLIVLLIVFTFVIGPGSFFLARRRGTPMLALVLTPAFGLLGSAIVFGGAVAANGLSVRRAASSWTLLDQRANRAATAEVRTLVAGISGELRVDPASTCVIPDYEPRLFRPDNLYPFGRNREALALPPLRIDTADGCELSGGFLPPRRAVRQLVLSERASRLRLEVKRSADGKSLIATNGLSVPVTTLFVRLDPGELWWLTEERLAPGAACELEPLPAPGDLAGSILGIPIKLELAGATRPGELRADRAAVESWWKAIAAGAERLASGQYVALTEGSPFLEDGGLEIDDEGGAHGSHGILGTLDDVAGSGR